MELYDSTGALLDSNDNWQESLDSGEIVESGLAPSDLREAAIVARLAPGSYTAIISGVNKTTGIGLSKVTPSTPVRPTPPISRATAGWPREKKF